MIFSSGMESMQNNYGNKMIDRKNNKRARLPSPSHLPLQLSTNRPTRPGTRAYWTCQPSAAVLTPKSSSTSTGTSKTNPTTPNQNHIRICPAERNTPRYHLQDHYPAITSHILVQYTFHLTTAKATSATIPNHKLSADKDHSIADSAISEYSALTRWNISDSATGRGSIHGSSRSS